MGSPENETEGVVSPDDLGWGSVSFSWDWFSIVQLVLVLVGIIGNSLVIAVYLKKLRVGSNSNKLIALLALADLLTSVGAFPLPSLSHVPPTAAGRLYCKLVHSRVVMWIAIVASVFTLTLLSAERFFAVVYPVRHKVAFSKSRLKLCVGAVWLAAVVLNCGSFYIPDVSPGNFCALLWPSPAYQAVHGLTLFVLEFVIPVAVMVVSHYFAARGLKRQAESLLERNKSKSSPAFSLLRSRGRVIRMVLIVVITFIIFWAPDQIGFLVLNFGGLSPEYFSSLTYRSFTVLAFLNSCTNPVIYIGLNKNFRAAVGQLFPCVERRVGTITPDPTSWNQPQQDSGAQRRAGGGQQRPTSTLAPAAPHAKNPSIFTVQQHQPPIAPHASSSEIQVDSCS